MYSCILTYSCSKKKARASGWNRGIGSNVTAPAGAKLADGSTPQHARQAGNSKGDKNNMLNRPQLDVDERCPVADPETGLACIKTRSSSTAKGKRYWKNYCNARPLGCNTAYRCHDFRRKPDEAWP
eukprot:COSAG05_NODE_3213_length_2238_cov_2.330996_2_plen_126_part_00